MTIIVWKGKLHEIKRAKGVNIMMIALRRKNRRKVITLFSELIVYLEKSKGSQLKEQTKDRKRKRRNRDQSDE